MISIKAIISIARGVWWGGGDVYYLFAIGASAGALLLATLFYTFGIERLKKVALVGLIVASAMGFASPLILIANLHQPGRFYYLFFHTHLASSPMSWGTFILVAYLFLVVVLDVLVYHALKTGVMSPVPATIRWVGGATGFFALAIIFYTGFEVAVVRAIPMWHTALMPVLFFTASALSGISLVVILGWIDGRIVTNEERGFLGALLFGFLLLDALLQLIWLIVVVLFGGRRMDIIRTVVLHQRISSYLWVGFLLTVVLPAFLLLLPTLRRAWGTLLAASVLAVVGAWVLRWNIVIVGQEIPKTSTNFNHYAMALTGYDSLLTIMGNIGLVIFLLIVLEWGLDMVSERAQNTHGGESMVDGGVA